MRLPQALVMEIIAKESQEHWLVLFNASGYIHFRLPEPEKVITGRWLWTPLQMVNGCY